MTLQARIPYFDFLRGIAILMVISNHTFETFPLSSNLIGNIKMFTGQLIQCAVPIFIAISGFFISRKQTDYLHFLKRQIPKIYIPLLIWSFPYYFKALHNGYNVFPATAFYFCCGFSIYYFIALILQLYLLSPILCKLNRHKGWRVATVLITAITLLIISYIINIKGVSLPLIVYAGTFPVWLAYFSLGIYLGSMRSREYKITPWIIIAIIGILLCYIESHILLNYYNKSTDLKLSTFIYSYSLIILLLSNRVQNYLSKDIFLFRMFVWIGNISFGIYLIHMFIFDFIITADYTYGWIFDTICVLSITALFIYALEWILPKNISKYLGLR